jgi:hypothetical protein
MARPPPGLPLTPDEVHPEDAAGNGTGSGLEAHGHLRLASGQLGWKGIGFLEELPWPVVLQRLLGDFDAPIRTSPPQ